MEAAKALVENINALFARINMYDYQSVCMKDNTLKKICNCIKTKQQTVVNYL